MKKFSNNCLTFIIILFGICLIIFSSSNILTVQSSLNLFLNGLFPSLFPFLVVSELLSHTRVISFLSTKCEKIMKPLFNVSGVGVYPFIMGLICGYPVGAKIVSDLRNNNMISKDEGEHLLIFTNNAGPLFIIGTVGCSIYLNSTIGFLLLFVHILSSIFTGVVFGHIHANNYRISATNNDELTFSSLGEILSLAIKKSFYTLSTVCGFVIIFSLIISMLQTSGILNFIHNIWIQYFLLGVLEITSGINLISTIHGSSLLWNIVITSFLLGCGGISVFLQVWSLTSKTDLSIKPYIIGKIFNGITSSLIMFVILNIFPILQFTI